MTQPNGRDPTGYLGVKAPNPPNLIIADRAPTVTDIPEMHRTHWLDRPSLVYYAFGGSIAGEAQWIVLGGSSADVNTINNLSPTAGNIEIAGTADQILVSDAGSTVTLSLEGPYTPATYTDHGVLVGSGASDITALAVGTDGEVLTGNTGADPSFEAIGTLSGLADGGVILGGGAGPFTATALGTSGQVLTSNGAGVDPTFQTVAGGTTADYADFYALMPGDNSSTVAVGAAIELPNDGPNSGTSITRLTATTFQLADIATYSVSFQCSFDEAGQWMLKLDGDELAETVSGRATGTNQAYISCLITTTTTDQVLSVINPTGNSTALTITPIAGGASAVSAHLVIQRVAGGPGGGLLNTINSIVPVAGNIDIDGTADQIIVTDTAGTATASLADGVPRSVSVTLTAVEVKALATTQIELVAAPGAGKALAFLGAHLKLVFGSEVFTETGDNLAIKYTDASGVKVSEDIEMTGFIDQGVDTYTSSIAANDAIVAATGAENQALVLDNINSNIAGNASDDSTLVVTVVYTILDM